MPLANISSMPATDQSRQVYDFSHYQDHLEIVQAINSQNGTALMVHAIHPAIEKGQDWKRLHQAMHDAMNKALKLSQGQDFTGEMDKEWHYSNYNEHLAARAKLGI